MPVAKLTKMMKLKLFLWLVVYAFLIYALIVDVRQQVFWACWRQPSSSAACSFGCAVICGPAG